MPSGKVFAVVLADVALVVYQVEVMGAVDSVLYQFHPFVGSGIQSLIQGDRHSKI